MIPYKSLHQSEMFRISLACACPLEHLPAQLAGQIPWVLFHYRFFELYFRNKGRLGFLIRMMAGLLLLKHAKNLSDEKVVEWRPDRPHVRYCYGKTHFLLDSQLNSSSLCQFRLRIEESTMIAGLDKGALKKSEFEHATAGVAVLNRSNFAVTSLAFPGHPYVGYTLTTQTSQVEQNRRGKNVRSVRGPWLPRSRSLWFIVFHLRSEALGECNVGLHCAPHAYYFEEDQDFLRRFLAMIECLLRVGKINVAPCFPEMPSICLKLPEKGLEMTC